jgi:hypothetical protein
MKTQEEKEEFKLAVKDAIKELFESEELSISLCHQTTHDGKTLTLTVLMKNAGGKPEIVHEVEETIR